MKVITNVKGLQATIYGDLYEIISEDSVKGDSIKKYPPQNEPAHIQADRKLEQDEYLFTWWDANDVQRKGVLKVKLIKKLVERK